MKNYRCDACGCKCEFSVKNHQGLDFIRSKTCLITDENEANWVIKLFRNKEFKKKGK